MYKKEDLCRKNTEQIQKSRFQDHSYHYQNHQLVMVHGMHSLNNWTNLLHLELQYYAQQNQGTIAQMDT